MVIKRTTSMGPTVRRDISRSAIRREKSDRLKASEEVLVNAKSITYVREGGVCGARRPGCTGRADDCQHRTARGMGGSSRAYWVNMPSNLLWLCRSCHQWAESRDPAAETLGFVISRGVDKDPQTVPILYRGAWALLDDSGSVTFTGQLYQPEWETP